jgi:TRAP-type C4-dicarboxylate transport system substrate-binding protein
MRKNKGFKGVALVLISLILFVAGCSSGTSGSNENPTKAITLNAVSFLATDNPLTATIPDWIKAVEESTEGRVKVNWRGGADVIPISEQFEALNSGVIDVNFTYIGQYQTQLPESLSIALSQLTPWEERESGFYDTMVERHKEIGATYLGRWLTGSPRLWLKEPINLITDLENMKIRSAPNYNRFFDDLGIAAAMIDPAEVYTSLQTGVVEGFVYGGLSGPRKEGWTDSAKYVLDIPFWTQNCTILMNNSKWDEISEKDQQAIINATAQYEKGMVDYYTSLDVEERKELEKIGVEFISLPEEDKQKFLEMAYASEWGFIEAEKPELVDTLRQQTTLNK